MTEFKKHPVNTFSASTIAHLLRASRSETLAQDVQFRTRADRLRLAQQALLGRRVRESNEVGAPGNAKLSAKLERATKDNEKLR
ncbi:MAG: hypothetical protein ACRD3W_24620, partial [Terriglobales bacterium]